MESTQKYLTASLLVLLVLLAGSFIVIWQQNNALKELTNNNQSGFPDNDVVVNFVDNNKNSKIEEQMSSVPDTRKLGDIPYKNTKYNFGLTLPKEYVGYKVVEFSNFVKNSGGKDLGFTVPTTGTNWDGTFEVFRILTYPLKWADANTHLSDGDLRLNSDDGLGGYLGQYLGKNANYIFAITKGQDCPTKGADNSYQTTQCYLYEHVDDLVKSFEILK